MTAENDSRAGVDDGRARRKATRGSAAWLGPGPVFSNGSRNAMIGNGRGRHCVAGGLLLDIQDRRRAARAPLRDPYPWMRAKLAEPRDSRGELGAPI
jgi:hypothetical protein